MNYCNNPFCLWLSKHIVTTIIIAIVTAFTFTYFVLTIYSNNLFNNFSIFFCNDISCLGWFIIWELLLSGLEVSIGSIKYFLWIFFNSFLVLVFRTFVNINTTSCYYILYSQFLPFLLMHKPSLYMKIKKLSFTDTHLYAIAMIQTLILCQNFFDILIVILGNLTFKIILKLFKPCMRPTVADVILHDDQGIGAELTDHNENGD